jgi:hypothetical protein
LVFIGVDLLSVHVTGADRANAGLVTCRSPGKDDENGPACGRSPSSTEPTLVAMRVWANERRADKETLDLGNGNPVFPTLEVVPRIPVEPVELHGGSSA